MAQGTAQARTDHSDHSTAHSVVMAALGQSEEPEVEDAAASSDTDATETATDDVEDSDESVEEPEESSEEGSESDEQEEGDEDVEAKASPEGEDDLFTKADQAKLAKAPEEIQKLAKSLRRSFAEKTTELSEVRKFRDVLKGDPKAVLEQLAKAHGLAAEFRDPKAAAATNAAVNSDPIQAVIAKVRAKFAPLVGEETADELVNGFNEIARAGTETAVAPIIRENTAREQAQLVAHAKAEMERFAKDHPDWQKHEAAMTALAERVQPRNMGMYELTKFLYDNVTRDQQITKAKTDAEGKHAAKVKKAVADAEPPPRTRVPGTKVKTAPPVYKSSRDMIAAALAEQGITV